MMPNFTVGDLKQLLERYPNDLPIGVVGHFGEFLPMSIGDFGKAGAYPFPEGKFLLGDMLPDKIDIFFITSPDLGPEPD